MVIRLTFKDGERLHVSMLGVRVKKQRMVVETLRGSAPPAASLPYIAAAAGFPAVTPEYIRNIKSKFGSWTLEEFTSTKWGLGFRRYNGRLHISMRGKLNDSVIIVTPGLVQAVTEWTSENGSKFPFSEISAEQIEDEAYIA